MSESPEPDILIIKNRMLQSAVKTDSKNQVIYSGAPKVERESNVKDIITFIVMTLVGIQLVSVLLEIIPIVKSSLFMNGESPSAIPIVFALISIVPFLFIGGFYISFIIKLYRKYKHSKNMQNSNIAAEVSNYETEIYEYVGTLDYIPRTQYFDSRKTVLEKRDFHGTIVVDNMEFVIPAEQIIKLHISKAKMVKVYIAKGYSSIGTQSCDIIGVEPY